MVRYGIINTSYYYYLVYLFLENYYRFFKCRINAVIITRYGYNNQILFCVSSITIRYVSVWIQLNVAFMFSVFRLFFFPCAWTVISHDFTVQGTKNTVHALFTGLTTLFTYLKIILLQCFQFSVSAKISSIQTDLMYLIFYSILLSIHVWMKS